MADKFERLKENIKTHNSPLGIAISGGLDSTVILHELSVINNPYLIHAYSMKWDDSEEGTYECNMSEKIARAYDVKFKPIPFSGDGYWNSLNECMKTFDKPRWNVWPYLILEEAHRDGVKDFYVGEGCDEIFGYQDRSYLKGWIGQLEYITPVWRQVCSMFDIHIHMPYLELETGKTLPSTLNYFCGRYKIDLWEEYQDKLQADVIYPKKTGTPLYYRILDKTKSELQFISSELWVKHHA